MNILRILFKAATGLCAAFIGVSKTFVSVLSSFADALVSLTNATGPIVTTFTSLLGTAFNIFGTLFNSIVSVIVKVFGTIFNVIATVIRVITFGAVNLPEISADNINIPDIDFQGIVEAIAGAITAILSLLGAVSQLLQMAQNFLNWCSDNIEITTYLSIMALVGIGTLFPVISTIITSIPVPILIGLTILYFLPIVLYLYRIYVTNEDPALALQFTQDFMFNIVPFMAQNLDVVIYLGLILFEVNLLQNSEFYEFMKDLFSRIVLLDILYVVVIVTAIPLLMFLYYYFVQKATNIFDAIQDTRQNLLRTITGNLDLLAYSFILFTIYLGVTDQGFVAIIHTLLPEFLYIDLCIIVIGLAVAPLVLIIYFIGFQNKQLFDAVNSTRDVVYSLGSNIASGYDAVVTKVFKSSATGVQAPPIMAAPDPNPGLMAAERMFFAQLFGDNLGVAPYNNAAQYPFYAELDSSISPVPINTNYGLYDLLLYEDLNAEFYGNRNYEYNIYKQYFGKRMTRAQYIAIPFKTLTGNSVISTNLTNVIFQCFGLTQGQNNINTLSDISDSVLKSYATGYGQASLATIEQLLINSVTKATNPFTFPVGAMLQNFLNSDTTYTTATGATVKYPYAWLQAFCLQTPVNNIPGNLYALACQATGVTNIVQSYIGTQLNSIQIKASNVQSLASAPTNTGLATVSVSTNPIAFWNYAYAAAQQMNDASFMTIANNNNAYNDFNTALTATSSGNISGYFLASDTYRSLWLDELYKLITASTTSLDSSKYDINEMIYKSFQGQQWSYLGVNYQSNLTDLSKDYLNGNAYVITDAFTLAIFNAIEGVITNAPTVATFNSTAYTAILNSASGSAPYGSGATATEPYFSELWNILDQSIRNDGNQGTVTYNNQWLYSWILNNAMPYIGWNTSATVYSSTVFVDALNRGYVHNISGVTDSKFLWYPFNGGFWLYNVPRIDAQTIANQIKVNDFGNIDNFFTQSFNAFGQGSPTGTTLYTNMINYLTVTDLLGIVTLKVANVQNATSAPSTNITTTNFTQAQASGTSQSSIAFWNYAYAAVQNSGNSGLISATSGYNAYTDFINGLNGVASGNISAYFLGNDAYRDLWLAELYKVITGSPINTSTFEMYELVYKAFYGKQWSYLGVNYQSNLTDLSKDYLNGNAYVITDAFTLAIFNAIEGVITEGLVDNFNSTAYNNILTQPNGSWPYYGPWGGVGYTERYFSEKWKLLDMSIRNDGNQGAILFDSSNWLSSYLSNTSYIGLSQAVFVDALNRGYTNSTNGNTGSQYLWYPFNGGFWLYNVPRIDAQTIANQIKVNDSGNIDNFFTQVYNVFQGISPTGQDLYTRMMQYIDSGWNPIQSYARGVTDSIRAYGSPVNNTNDLRWDVYINSGVGNYCNNTNSPQASGSSEYHCTYSLLVNSIISANYGIGAGNIVSNLGFTGQSNLNSLTIWQRVLDSTSLDGAFCSVLADTLNRPVVSGGFDSSPYNYTYTSPNAPSSPSVGTIMMFAKIVSGSNVGGDDNSWVWDQIIVALDSLYGQTNVPNPWNINLICPQYSQAYGQSNDSRYATTTMSPFAGGRQYNFTNNGYDFPHWPSIGLYYNFKSGGTGTNNNNQQSSRTFFNAQSGFDPSNIYQLNYVRNNNAPWGTPTIRDWFFTPVTMINYNGGGGNYGGYTGSVPLNVNGSSATIPSNYVSGVIDWPKTRFANSPITSFYNREWFSNQFVRYLMGPVWQYSWDVVNIGTAVNSNGAITNYNGGYDQSKVNDAFNVQNRYAIYSNAVNQNYYSSGPAPTFGLYMSYPGDPGNRRTLNDVGQNGNGTWGPKSLWGNYNINNKYSLVTTNTTLLDFYKTCYLHAFFYMYFNRNNAGNGGNGYSHGWMHGITDNTAYSYAVKNFFKPTYGAGNGKWPGYGMAANVDGSGNYNSYVSNSSPGNNFSYNYLDAGYGTLLSLYAYAVKDLLNQCYNYFTGLTCNQGNSYSGYQNMVNFYTNLCYTYNFSQPNYNTLQTVLNNYIYNTAWNNGIVARNVLLNLAGWGGGLASGVFDYGNSNLYTTGGTTKLMQAVINTYNYTQGTLGGSNTPYAVNQLPGGVYNGLVAGGQPTWCCIAWTLAFRSNYAILLSLPTTFIGQYNTVSEKGRWGNTWPCKFASNWNANLVNGRRTLSIDYSNIFTTIFNNMKSAGALNYDSWISNFYDRARQSKSLSTGGQTKASLNQYMYQAAWNVLNNKSTTGTASGAKTNSTSGTNTGNFYLREDMPGEWWSVLMQGNTNNANIMNAKCSTYYGNITSTAQGNQSYRGIFAQKFVDAILSNSLINGATPTSTQQVLKDYIYNTEWPNMTVGFNVLANLAGWGGAYGSQIYSSGGTTKLMQAVISTYGYTQALMSPTVAQYPLALKQLPTGVYNGLVVGSNPTWCPVTWTLAFRANYAQLLSLPTTFIGPGSNVSTVSGTVSNKNYWGGTWPARFANFWNSTKNSTNNRTLLNINYSTIFTTVFSNMKSANALKYDNWIQNFYNLAKTVAGQTSSVGTQTKTYLNRLMYQAAFNVLNKVNPNATISGNKISNLGTSGTYLPLREDMPGEWWSTFMLGNQSNSSVMNQKCQTYYSNMINAVAYSQSYSTSFPQKLVSAIGSSIVGSLSFDYTVAYQTQIEYMINNLTLGPDNTFLTNFYNLINPPAVGSTGLSAASPTDQGALLQYAFRAIQAISPNDVDNWGQYFFQNPADQDKYKSSTYSICYNAAAYGDPANTPWPSVAVQAQIWPNLIGSGSLLQPPTTSINSSGVSVDISQPSADGVYNTTYISYCNACYIQNSIAELRSELSTVSDAYSESIQRFNIYAYKWGLAANPLSQTSSSVGTITNPNFAMTLDQMKNYSYTFANGAKNIVMFNDFVSYSVLPATYNSAGSNISNSLDSIIGGVITSLGQSSSSSSSSNLFSVADRTLQLIGNGININSILGLYNNLRQANVNFLFNTMSSNGQITGDSSTLSTQNLLSVNDSLSFSTTATASSPYASSSLIGLNQLQGQAQVQSVLRTFTQSINLTYIQQAIQDAPGQNGVDDSGRVKDYGSPYIRRLFYDAAAVLDSIYTDIFGMLTSNVFRRGAQYVPNPNDPVDMMWFRYNVQNWNNPFNGSKYGDGKYKPNTTGGDGADSYIAKGFYAPSMSSALNSVIAAYNNLIYTNPQTKYPGIYPRIISLLNYVTSYNNIINQAYNYTTVGTTALAVQAALMKNLSNKYLRLGQNNQYMDLMSLYAGTYQHFHINLPLGVNSFVINPQTQQSLQANIARMDISTVANLDQWLSKNLAQDPGYTIFKNEIATTFIFKTLLDIIWWPQFCLDYFYNTGGTNTTTHRFTSSTAIQTGNMDATQMGHLIGGRPQLSLALIGPEVAQTRLNSTYLTSSNNQNVNNLKQFDASNLIGYSANTIWQSMCYSYQHDAMFAYMFFTAPINGLTTTYTNITNSNDKLMNVMNGQYSTYNNNMNDTQNSTILSGWNWLQNYTCFGGTTLPQQMIDAGAPAATISAAANAKFGQSAAKHWIMRQQFFADPMSWFNLNRSYQIYPLVFANPSSSLTGLAPTAAPWIYQASVSPTVFWPITTASGTQYANTFYQVTSFGDFTQLNYANTFAPIMDTSMAS